MVQVRSAWTPLVVVGDSSAAGREASAARALADGHGSAAEGGDICFPMMVGDKPIGALGVASHPLLSPHEHSMIAAAAALLAVSLKNAELFNEVRENSVRDALTGCFNRAYALDALDTELRRRRRSQTPLSVVMFDLDRFKTINDGHGHLCGDAVLASVAARLKAVLRGGDVKCRYGGEEFLILLPDTPLAGARHVAETLRRDIEEHPVRWREETVHVTASFGVTTAAPADADALTLVARVDDALYVAKHSGRNCVRLAEENGEGAGASAPGTYDEAEGQRVNAPRPALRA
jgi:diguanylate cyclase (GGDEF)-like protein